MIKTHTPHTAKEGYHSQESSQDTTTIGKYLLDRLEQLGVGHIFGIPGDYVIRFDKLIEQHSIKFINTTRENTAGYMADAYARLKGLGVACITYGVGINIANALSQAYVESSPLVVISGSAGTAEQIKGYKLHHLINKSFAGNTENTQLEMFKYITIDQAVLDNPDTAADQIDRVLDNCLLHKKPVYIEIPRDMVEKTIPHHKIFQPSSLKTDAASLQEALDEVTAILQKAKHPVIWAGHEIQRFGLVPELLHFAESYHIPIVSSLLGKTVISERHPLFVGVYFGHMSRPEVCEFVESCDCAIILGLILTDVDTGIFTANIAKDKCVLATQESIQIHHHQYNNLSLKDFMHGLSRLNLNLRYRTEYPASVERERIIYQPKAHTEITSKRVFECIQHHLKREHIVVADIGDSLFGSADLILEQNSYFACAYFATLGFGTPGAIGAQIAEPKKRILGIIGDGAFQISSMELSTAVRYGLDPIIIVLNNHGYGSERPILEGAYNDIQDWNYTKIPQVIGGGIGIKVSTEEELDNALKQALSERGTFYLIEVELEKTDFSPALRRFGELLGGKS